MNRVATQKPLPQHNTRELDQQTQLTTHAATLT